MSDKEGFFKKFHESVNNCLDDVSRNNFANLESNSKRVTFLCNLPALKSYDLGSDIIKCQTGRDIFVSKDSEKAKQLKDEGNKAVQKGDWAKALQFYSQGLLFVPQKETEEVSILYANRSAALSHLEQYEETLSDIKRCLSLGYPKHLRYKVYERRARTLLAVKDIKKLLPLSNAKLMLEILNKGITLAGNPKDPEPAKSPPKPKLPGKNNPQYPAASDSIQIDYDIVKGRYATASRDIQAGDTLLIEKPFSGVLLGEFSKTHCQNCFMKCHVPIPCLKCPNVIFCSEKCSDVAQKTYHGYECQILPLLWKSGCSITCHIALRMITQNKKQYFNDISPKINEKPTGTYRNDDYRNVYHLVAHENERTKQDFLHRTQMTAFLVKLLEISGYFDGHPREKPIEMCEFTSMGIDEKYKEDVALIGGLILKNLQILQFNAHEVFELQCPKPRVGNNIIKHTGKSVFLAGAVFPTLALFNHSCDPGVVRYFCGPYIVVRAIKNIRRGEEVAENYGPIFTIVSRSKRQADLKDQYWFDCTCVPCHQNWPRYEEMTENYMRFKCDSDHPCPNVVPVPYDCQEFMVKCGLCEQYTNILKGLKSLQDTDMMYKLGRAAMEEGKYGEAIKKFVEMLKLYDTTLAPPYKSYYDCMQDLRRCMLAMGNYSIV